MPTFPSPLNHPATPPISAVASHQTFALKMTVLRIASLVVFCAGLLGCSATADKDAECCANYESPSFVISFSPKSMQEKEPIVDISEDSSGAAIRVDWSPQQYRISDTSRYLRLKKRMLTSSQWEKRVPESQLLGFFTGPPRDIITVRSGDKGICLQGSDVPRGWRDELIRLARTGKGTKIGEQGGGGQPATRPESK
jgi:hypothetical protein